MKVAVTGASGRIGNVVVRQLLEKGHEIRVLSRQSPRSLHGLPLEWVQGELLDPGSLQGLMQGCEVVIHLAALISVRGPMGGRVQRTNLEGTRAVLEAAEACGLRRAICFSSIHAFEQHPQAETLDETRPLALQSRMAYDRSKAAALAYSLQFAREHKLEVLALCPTSVIGPFDFAPSMSGRMLIDFYKQKIPMLTGGGFDWCDVRNVAAAAVSALEKGRSGEAYLLGGTYLTVLELSQLVGKITGKPTPGRMRVAPDWLLRLALPLIHLYAWTTGAEPLYTAEALDTLLEGCRDVSSEKAVRELGYAPNPIEKTIADAYSWFEQNEYL